MLPQSTWHRSQSIWHNSFFISLKNLTQRQLIVKPLTSRLSPGVFIQATNFLSSLKNLESNPWCSLIQNHFKAPNKYPNLCKILIVRVRNPNSSKPYLNQQVPKLCTLTKACQNALSIVRQQLQTSLKSRIKHPQPRLKQ